MPNPRCSAKPVAVLYNETRREEAAYLFDIPTVNDRIVDVMNSYDSETYSLRELDHEDFDVFARSLERGRLDLLMVNMEVFGYYHELNGAIVQTRLMALWEDF